MVIYFHRKIKGNKKIALFSHDDPQSALADSAGEDPRLPMLLQLSRSCIRRSFSTGRILRTQNLVTEVSQNDVVSFYNAKVINYANRSIRPVTLKELIRFGQPPLSRQSLTQCAHYARTELPVRLAMRVRAFQNLPFIVGTNPHIKDVYRLYYESFDSLEKYSDLQDSEYTSDVEFAEKLKDLVERHADNIPTLARGFLECKKYMNTKDMTAFLDDMIHARIGIRLIAEQCISLIHATKEENNHDQLAKNYIGIINTQLSPARVIRQCADFVTELCEFNYGEAPEIIVTGHVDTTFTYVPVHLEYILTELLKNAARATVENAKKANLPIPAVEVAISHGSRDIGIRVRDQGGGVKPEDLNHIFEYSYTTVKNDDHDDSGNIFSGITRLAMQSGVGGPMAGLGFGLPLARMYAQYFGGSMTLISLYGYGCDIFLKLKHIDESLGQLEI
ncbi:hypothetical protein INT43_002336 [Umbelopsis isabellina]|uniref:Protein-serine/threonine kinase n=1 Tax=Mortierella isabellina TaxID=91625 RepID=A0A8H7Q4U1_MORIS|nr:hypothetical protein INT43_002336 [Umbelopsis isabellina]